MGLSGVGLELANLVVVEVNGRERRARGSEPMFGPCVQKCQTIVGYPDHPVNLAVWRRQLVDDVERTGLFVVWKNIEIDLPNVLGCCYAYILIVRLQTVVVNFVFD